MRFSWRRGFWATSLLACFLLLFAGCSSNQQQSQDGLASGQEEEAGEEGEDASESGNEGEGQDNFAGNLEGGALEGNNNELLGGNNNEAVVANGAAEGDAAADNDLTNIINEMNQQAATPPAGGADSAAGMAAPVSTAAAAPPAPPTGGGVITGSAGAAAGPGLPEFGSKLAYIVKSGDTLGKIAGRILGDPKRFRELADLSNIPNPNHIYPGDVIYYQLSNESLAFATDYENIARQEVVVQAGDTLATIATKVYGSTKHWQHIWRQNGNITDPDNLEVGSSVSYVPKDVLAKIDSEKTQTINLAQEGLNQDQDSEDPKPITVEILNQGFELTSFDNLALDFSADLIDV